METSGGGAAEVRLYRRPSYGAALVDLGALKLVAPPRLVKAGSKPPSEEIDGEFGRSEGLYLALVQDGQFVDVARLIPYAGEAAGADDEAEDYLETGSNTSDDDWGARPAREARVFEYRLSSSDEDEDDDREEDVEDGEEVNNDDGEEEDNDGDEDEDDDELQGQPVKLKLRLWLAKKHMRIKIFSGIRWIATKVYRLSWMNHQQLEELSESSKMDISAPIARKTVFSIRDSVMDFDMVHTPNCVDLVSEFRPSIMDFKFCLKLGGEESCRVFKCLYQGRKFALKTVCLDQSCSTEPREVDIISSLKDERVMAFYQAWIEPWSYKKRAIADYLFIQLELCESTLKDQLLPENFESIPDRWYLYKEIAECVNTIHDELIVHRDLKPDNIFFGVDGGVRIGDFGDACMGRDEFGRYGGTPSLGTEHYFAPELETAEKITEKADIYPVGVMFIEIFTTFKTVSEKHRLLRGLRDKGLPDDWVPDLVGDREGTREFVERMIAKEPAYRPSAEDILDYIQQ